jgi:hypothetical protein
MCLSCCGPQLNVTRKVTARPRTNISSTNSTTKQLNTGLSRHTPLQALKLRTGSERRSPNRVRLVTLYIFGASMRRIKVTCDSKQPCSVLCHVIPPTLLRVADGQHYAGSVRCVRDAALKRRCSVSVPAAIDCAIIAREPFFQKSYPTA